MCIELSGKGRSLSPLSPSQCSNAEKGQISGPDGTMGLELRGAFECRAFAQNMDPVPSESPNDPLNWPSWRKNVLLFIVAFHAMQSLFSASIIIPGFEAIALEFHTTVPRVSYLLSVQIVFLGVMPLIWTPISARIGRRPVYLISALVSSACALAGAFCYSYGTLMTTRVFQAIFLAPPLSLGASTVSELFFAYQRGSKMGIWTLLVTCGGLLAPISTGYLIQDKGWRSAFYLLAGIHSVMFFSHLFLGPETLYPQRSLSGQSAVEDEVSFDGWRQLFAFRVYDKRPIHWWEIVRPLVMFARPVVLLVTVAYTLTFAYTGIIMSIMTPQLFGGIFHLTSGQIGLQFIALLVGAVLGEQIGGYGSDQLVNWRTRRNGGERVPEYRLALAYPGLLLSIIGLVVWGVQLQNATPGKWNITPDIGSAIAMFGMQIVSTVCYTYAVESYISETADVSAFIGLFRQIFGFIAAFYFPHTYDSLGTARASGLFAGLIGLAMMFLIACNVWGPRWRERTHQVKCESLINCPDSN